jgi:3-oxoacyl-[acyl-carrier protein] reductase
VLDERAGLAGKVAVVTGGAGGLGLAITQDLLACGVSVACCDRNAEAVAQLEPHPNLIAEHFDVRDIARQEAFFRSADTAFGRLDILVNVVGGSFWSPFVENRPRGWQATIEQNFTYLLHSTQSAIALMRRDGICGSIVNITSVEAHRAIPSMAVYGAMKAAVASLARTLAVELGPLGIRINNVAPDIFPTEAVLATGRLTDDGSDLATLRARVQVPMGRYGRPQEVSNAVLFLASDLASYITGTTLHVDGGTLASSGWSNWPGGYEIGAPDSVLSDLIARSPTTASG